MNIKKIAAIMLVSVMLLSMLVACADTTDATNVQVDTTVSQDGGISETAKDVIYVDAAAADGGNGSEAAPYKTIAEAQAKIREIKSGEGLPEGGITVILADGDYPPIVFEEADSGEENAPIKYLSKNKHGANVTGGVRLDKADFEPASADVTSRLYDSSAADKLLQLDLTKYGLTADDWGKEVTSRGSNSGYSDFEAELFINNERMLLGQYPNEKWITATAITDGSEGAKADLVLEADAAEHIAKWQDKGDLWVHGYLSVSYFDYSSKITLGDGVVTVHDISGSDIVTHVNEHGAAWFWFYNVLEEVDSPGEYYIDRETGMLYLYTPENFDSAEMVLSVNTEDLVYGKDVSNIIFEDITFTASRREAIRIYSGNNITVDGCIVAGIRSLGIAADGNNITVQNCDVHDIGATAVGVSGGDTTKLIESGNLIYNNTIHDFAQTIRTYNPGIYLKGCGDTASHNEVFNTAHSALMYQGQLATFEYNEIYNVCTETLDCGAFYTGRSLSWYGTVLRYNYFHDVGSSDVPGNDKSYFKASGIYLDDGLSGVELYGNIVQNTTGRGLYIGGGRDITVSNNIIINPGIFVLEFDSRMWDAAHTDYGWFSPAILQAMTEDIAKYLDGEYGDIWKEKFPSLATAKPSFEPGVLDPTTMIAPVNNKVTNNIYSAGSLSVYTDAIEFEPMGSYNTVDKNWPIRTTVFEDYENGNFTIKADAGMWNFVPDFEQIPWQEIGCID